jgi:hypothetical protein
LRAADLAALAAFDRTPPRSLALPAEVARPSGALETLLRSCVETFAERSFRSYRHLRSAAAGRD